MFVLKRFIHKIHTCLPRVLLGSVTVELTPTVSASLMVQSHVSISNLILSKHPLPSLPSCLPSSSLPGMECEVDRPKTSLWLCMEISQVSVSERLGHSCGGF